jgi:hypothetical protein
MKRLLALAAALLIAAVWWQLPRSTRESAAAPPEQARRLVAEGRAAMASPTAQGIQLLPGVATPAVELNAPDHDPDRDIEILESVVSEYRRIFGRNPPGGLNVEITAALTGQNPRRLAVLSPDSAALNAAGEVVDRWGTPFYFHPVSAVTMEVLSAGPDRLLWTSDDVGRIRPAGNVAAEAW